MAVLGFHELADLVRARHPEAEMKPVRAALGVVLMDGEGPNSHYTCSILEAEDEKRRRQLYEYLGRITFKRHPEGCSAFFMGMLQQAVIEVGPEYAMELADHLRVALNPATKAERGTPQAEATYMEYCLGRSKGATHADMVYLDPRFEECARRYSHEHSPK
jgi:hypothetical protein